MTNPHASKPIIYKDRYTGKEVREQVMAEAALRWIYGTTTGKIALHGLIKRAIFSRLLGYMKNRPSSRKDIKPFIAEYGIPMEESILQAHEFGSFNEFFYRRLKPQARPVHPGSDTAVFPADGRHMGWQCAADMRGVFIKGQSFDLPALLGSRSLGEQYAEGSVILSRLCPTDYHRFHFPTDGIPGEALTIPGPLASVSPYCLRCRLSWLWTNKRVLTLVQSAEWGQVAILEVGATGVGGIKQTYIPGEPVRKGDDKGYFYFGGSTVMTFFEPGRIRLADDLLETSSRHMELFARQGDIMGFVTSD